VHCTGWVGQFDAGKPALNVVPGQAGGYAADTTLATPLAWRRVAADADVDAAILYQGVRTLEIMIKVIKV
jgi:hypothetical protein